MGKDLKGKELPIGITQRKDGRYYARVKKNGKTYGEYFQSVKEAQNWLIGTQYKVTNDIMPTTESITLNQWYEQWIDVIKADTIEYRTKESYKELYESYISEKLGHYKLKDIKPIMIQQLFLSMSKKGLAATTIKKVKAVLNNLFFYAVENEYILKSPITKGLKIGGTASSERNILTKEQQNELVDKLINDHDNQELPIRFILTTGLRFGELIALKWEDIDLSKPCIYVKRSLYYNKEDKRYYEKPPKSQSGERTIPLTNTGIQILKEQKEKKYPTVLGYQNYIFRNANGCPLDRSNFNRTLRRVSSYLKLPSISAHCLRHTFATRCIENGMKPKTLQKILGHSKISVTMDLYVHITDEELFTEMIKMEA